MQNTIIIENAKKTDLPFLVDFQLKMALETEDLVLDKTVLEKGMASVLDDPSKARYFVVRKGELLAGMLMITLEWSDWRNGWVWWIQSVYVDKEFRKEGVFASLYSHVKEIVLKTEEIKGIRLYVDKRNVRAQKVYVAIGMTGEHYATFEWMKEF